MNEHNGHAHHHHAAPAAATVKDPVCGMNVDPATARAVSGSGGATDDAPAIGLAAIASVAAAGRTGKAPAVP